MHNSEVKKKKKKKKSSVKIVRKMFDILSCQRYKMVGSYQIDDSALRVNDLSDK